MLLDTKADERLRLAILFPVLVGVPAVLDDVPKVLADECIHCLRHPLCIDIHFQRLDLYLVVAQLTSFASPVSPAVSTLGPNS